MNSQDRKPILIAAVCVGIAMLLFVLGSGLGGRDAGGTAGWQDRLKALKLGSDLSISELQPAGGSCSMEASRITVIGSCVLAVAEFGGPFSLQVTKSAQLVALQPVKLTLTLEGTRTTEEVKAGCQTSAIFGRAGGAVTISCMLPTSPCTIELGPGKDCSKE